MTTTVGTSTTTGPVGCSDSDECTDPSAPVCVNDNCVPCTSDEQCEAKDAAAPACRTEVGDGMGQCVQCTAANPLACDGDTPVCDDAAGGCVGCSFHEQCPDSACEIATGACFDTACVQEVDADGGQDFTTIESAISDGCVVIVHERNGDVPYNENLNIDGISVALIAADGEQPRLTGTGGNPSLTVSGSGVAYVQGLNIRQNDVEGVFVDGGSVYLDRSAIVSNIGGGIALTGGAYALVRNCFVGGSVNDVAAIDSVGSTADIIYTTLAAASFGAGAALQCDGGSSITVRNSLAVMLGSDDEIKCAGADISYSATETNLGGTNTALGDMNTNWFTAFGAGDLSLNQANVPAAVLTAAQWQSGDPSVDIDGDARPTVDGTADVAGADIP
ncbi:MAG: hypothetical protein K1X88_29740 [Nannocystaceae bacterium]|nr:hypothetical protein [Nannocystaceae bacterium]